MIFNKTNAPIPFESQAHSQEVASSYTNFLGKKLLYLGSSAIDNNQLQAIYNEDNNLLIDSIRSTNLYTYTNGASFLAIDSTLFLFYLSNYRVNSCSNPLCIALRLAVLKNVNGSLVLINDSILNDSFINEKIALVKHADGKSWWIFTQESVLNRTSNCSDEFLYYHLKNNGEIVSKRQPSNFTFCNQDSNFGEMLFSRDGTRLVVANGGGGRIVIYNHDRCTGLLTNPKTIDILPQPAFPVYGLAFSPSAQFVYASAAFGNGNYRIFQYNLSGTSANNREIIADLQPQGNCIFGQLELGPDNKIYVASSCSPSDSLSRYLHRIDSPDLFGLSCDFGAYSIYLGATSSSTAGLPHFPNYNLGPLSIYKADAGPDTVYICQDTLSKGVFLGDSIPVTGVEYSWGGPDLLDSTTSRQLVEPEVPTYYYLTLTDTSIKYSCQSRIDTVLVIPNYDCTVSIRENMESVGLKVYPNPTSDKISIEVNRPAKFELYDLNGKQLYNHNLRSGNNQIQTNELLNGVYIYKIWVGGELIVTNKLVRY